MELERKYYFSTRSKVKDSDYVHIKERQNREHTNIASNVELGYLLRFLVF